LAKNFTKEYYERQKIKSNVIIPKNHTVIDNTSVTTVYCTKNYGIMPHKDKDLGLVYALWLLEHSSECDKHSSECLTGWMFYFYEYKIAVKLKDKTFILWDSNKYHGTVPGVPKNSKCKAKQWGVAMQIQGKFVHACMKHNE